MFIITALKNYLYFIRPTIKYVPLSIENTFKCDCRLLPFLLRLKSKNFIVTDVDLCLESVLEKSTRKNSKCPVMCWCGCVTHESDHFVYADCSSKGLSAVPHFFKNSISQKEVSIGVFLWTLLCLYIVSLFWKSLRNVPNLIFKVSLSCKYT